MRRTMFLAQLVLPSALTLLVAPVFVAGADVIYSQARQHNHSPGGPPQVHSKLGATIYGQSFAPWFDGTIEEIALGGTWEPEGTPEFRVELWRLTAPGCCPAERLALWRVYHGWSHVEYDPEGCPLAVFRTEECGGAYEVVRGQQYLLTAYLVGSSEEPYWWEYDMASGSVMAQHWISTDNGVTWRAPNPPPPPPEQGHPVWNFEFEIRGSIANENIETIYDQARGHHMTSGKTWYVQSYDGVVTAICAQNFTPRCPGQIQRITLGGGFGLSGGFRPNKLICEIWRPIVPSRYPMERLHRWTILTNDLVEGHDSEGVPTLTADVSSDPYELLAGQDYVFAAYSNGNYLAPLDWAIDVTHGSGKFWRSSNGGVSWTGPYWFGSPDDPSGQNPAANFEFVLEGPTGVLTTSPSRGTQLRAGWNWIAFPLIPNGSRDPADIIGEQVRNRLYTWDAIDKTIYLYPDDFTTINLGRGYILRLDESISVVMSGWSGCPATREIPVPLAGAQWIGVPGDFEIAQAAIRIRDDVTGVIRSPADDDAAPDKWMNWNWIYWDAVARTARICCFKGGDTADLSPWYAYRLFAPREDTTLIFEVPQGGR
jgi:hypothetical protein